MPLKILEIIKKNKELVCLAAVLLIGLFLNVSNSSQETAMQNDEPFSSADTFIPDGFSLVPIEIANYETLDSLLGQFGVIDLFTHNPLSPEKNKKIAMHIKILRAPKNPSHFAVLVPHHQAQYILSFTGPFMASVKNPKYRSGTTFGKQKVRSRIYVEE